VSQLQLIEIEIPGWMGDPEPEEFPQGSDEEQPLLPELARLERVAGRRTKKVPSRDPYLPGDRGDPPRRAGKIQPRRFSSLTMLKAVPGVMGFFSEEVPGEFWTRDADLAGPIAVVSCPCGAEVEVPEGRTAPCECERWYFNVVSRVLVGGGSA
jgi:hypothetical protein